VPAPPVSDAELSKIFDSLAAHRTLVVAVSGGADSLALLHLLVRWRQLRKAAGSEPTPELVAVTIDHGLREGSRSEALGVAAEAARLGVPHRLVTWNGPKPRSAIQSTARQARYRLLGGVAAESEGSAVVTAHTRDDQAETVLMRLARGSGIDGLAGMQPVERLPATGLADEAGEAARAIPLCRPLLSVPKARLVATLADSGSTWVEDPSNANPAFERTRIRAAGPALASIGLTSGPVALTADRLARARAALDWACDQLWRELVDVHGGAYGSLSAVRWRAQPEELRIRLLGRLLTAFGGNAGPVALAKAERLAGRLSAPGAKPATIAGCRIEPRDDQLLVWREAGRRDIPELQILPGQTAAWDHRFRISVPAAAGVQTWRVSSLGKARRQGMLASLALPNSELPAKIADTLPVVCLNGIPVFIPHLVWRAGEPAEVAEHVSLVRIAFCAGV
jgi:tRNA(Ile)-lysidine synthase